MKTSSLVLAAAVLLIIGCNKQEPAKKPRDTSAMLMTACPFSAREVHADGKVATRPFIRPEHVVSIRPAAKLYPGNIAMLIELNDSGQKRMLSYTTDNVGGRIAIFCGDKEIEKATISAPFSNNFRIDLPGKNDQPQQRP